MRSLTGRQGPCKSLRGGLLQGGTHGPIHHHCNIGGRVVNLHRLILWFVAFLSFAASAAFPLPSVYQYRGQDYSTAQAACAAYIAYVQPSNPNNTYSVGGVTEYSSYAVCRINASSAGGSWVDNVTIGKYTGSCPVGSVQTGSSCTCSEGYKDNGFGDGCVQINNDREDCFNFSISGQMPGGDLVIDYRYSGNVADGSKFCLGVEGMTNPGRGCTVTFNRTGLLDYGGGKIVSEGNLSMSSDSNMVDQSCALNPSPPDPTKKPEPPEEKCKNGYSGQVNGVTVCVTKVPDSGVGDETKETQSDDGTDTKRVKTEKNTTCTNGVCTTVTTVTTTTTNNASGVSNTTTQTSTTTEGKGTFCEENPSFKLCKDGEEDGSSFGGSCGAGFTCEGDAIQCAVAQEQHRRACKLFDDASEESQLYQSNKGKEGNQTTNLPGNETVNVAGRIDSSDALGASAAGVADLNVTVWGQSITLPFSMLNPYLAQLGNVLLAVSFLLALRIVARG
jgi:hypothetical protein